MTAPPAPTRAYDERLHVPLRWWVQGTMLVASLWLAMVVALPQAVAWSITAVAVLALVAALVSYGSARVSVRVGTEGVELHAGRAHVSSRWLGAVEALDAEATRRTAGRDADARAFLLLRPYVKRSVRVRIVDPADPTPYWLVSTRRPDALAAALTSVAGATGPGPR